MFSNLLSLLLLMPVSLLFFVCLCLTDVLMRVCYFFNRDQTARYVMSLQCYLSTQLLKVWGTKIRFNLNKIEIDPSKPVLFVASHHSSLDILLLCRFLNAPIEGRPLGFISRCGLDRHIPAISPYLRHYCHSLRRGPLNIGNTKYNEIVSYAKKINDNKQTTVIFPEGVKPVSCSEHSRQFNRKGLRLMMQSMPNAQIVPIVIYGTGNFFTTPRSIKDLLHCFPSFFQPIDIEMKPIIRQVACSDTDIEFQINQIEESIHKGYQKLTTFNTPLKQPSAGHQTWTH